MSVLSQPRTLNLAVFGYVRRLEESSSSHHGYMPHVVTELIMTYARDFFAWYSKKRGVGYRLFEDNPLKAQKTTTGYSFLASVNNFSSKTSQILEWEIKIVETDTDYAGPIALMIGYIAYPMESSIPNWDSYFSKKMQFGVLANSTNKCMKKYCSDGYGKEFAQQDQNYNIKNGDRFCFRFDFGTRKCSFGYNDDFSADVYRKIPKKIIPAVSIYNPMIIVCTKWNVFENGSL